MNKVNKPNLKKCYVYIYIYIYMCVCVCARICIYVPTHTHTHAYTDTLFKHNLLFYKLETYPNSFC